jgi:hypothetical protein
MLLDRAFLRLLCGIATRCRPCEEGTHALWWWSDG